METRDSVVESVLLVAMTVQVALVAKLVRVVLAVDAILALKRPQCVDFTMEHCLAAQPYVGPDGIELVWRQREHLL